MFLYSSAFAKLCPNPLWDMSTYQFEINKSHHQAVAKVHFKDEIWNVVFQSDISFISHELIEEERWLLRGNVYSIKRNGKDYCIYETKHRESSFTATH